MVPFDEIARFGFLSVESHPRECRITRVTVNGHDVTSRCYAADDIHGYADCYALNAEGRKYVQDDRVVRERLIGTVVIDFPHGLD